MSKIFPPYSEFERLMERAGLSLAEVSEKFGISQRTVYRWCQQPAEPSAAYNLVAKALKDMARQRDKVSRAPTESAFTFIDLFAGIGGFRKAFDAIGGQCVFTSEWDKNSRLTYQANYVCDHEIAGDIREYTRDESCLARIPKHDVLVAGFPCQPFSIAGVSKKNSLGKMHGFRCDTQGTLFFDLAQIIEYHRPPVILLENVKNLRSHDGGNTFRVIQHTLKEELGYHLSYRIIDGRSWVPQHRERIFIAAFRHDVGCNLADMLLPTQGPRLGSILHKTDGTEEDEPSFLENGQVPPRYTLSEHLWNYLQRYKEKHAAKGNGFGYSLVGPDDVTRTLSARYHKDGSEILVRQEGNRPRRLTPRECARLMGFDRPTESNFVIPVSDTQAYRQFGNSVVVPCATAIAKHMRPYILQAVQQRQAPAGNNFAGKGQELKNSYATAVLPASS